MKYTLCKRERLYRFHVQIFFSAHHTLSADKALFPGVMHFLRALLCGLALPLCCNECSQLTSMFFFPVNTLEELTENDRVDRLDGWPVRDGTPQSGLRGSRRKCTNQSGSAVVKGFHGHTPCSCLAALLCAVSVCFSYLVVWTSWYGWLHAISHAAGSTLSLFSGFL